MSAGFSVSKGRGVTHIRSLDGLRGMAALLVLFAHFSGYEKVWENVLGGGVGQLGVMIFFTLSGFLMAFLYFEKPISVPSALRFYGRRIARVYPLFAVVVLFFFAISTLLFGGRGVVFDLDLPMTIRHLTLQTGTGPLWTIPVEIIFYLFVPIFWLAYRKAGTIGLLVLIAAVLAAQAAADYKSYFMPLNKVSLTVVVHFFLFGFLVWWLYQATQNIETRAGWMRRGYDLGFVICLALLVPVFPRVFESLSGMKTAIWKPSMYMAYVPALLFFTAKSSLAQAAFGSVVPAFFGKISYSIYVWHMPCIAAVWKIGLFADMPVLRLSMVLLLTVCVSWLSYFVIEKPARVFLNKLMGARKPTKTNPTGLSA